MVSITYNSTAPNNNEPTQSSQPGSGSSRPAWMSDELVRDIPARKLDFLAQLFGQLHTGTPNERLTQKALMLRLVPLIKQARAEHLDLTPAELQAAIAAIRRHSDTQEKQRMDEILAKSITPASASEVH